MFEKLIKLFKKNKPEKINKNYLKDIWAITSTYWDFEGYIEYNRSRFFNDLRRLDVVHNIFYDLECNLKLGFKVYSLKELSEEYKEIKNSKIIKDIYTNCSDNRLQIEFCELLINIIQNQPQINDIYYQNFDEYIENINKILKNVGYFYSVTMKKIISVNNDFEEKNIYSLFPLLKDYGQTEEFISKAWKEYIDGDYDNSVINAGKATETVMKCICQRRAYSLNPDKDTFAKLFEILNTNNFFSREEYITPTLINNLIEGLKTGLPKHRNDSAHGSSLEAKNSNKYVAKLTLDLMISYIHYFISLDKQI